MAKKKSKSKPRAVSGDAQRINKVLAMAGLGSRREVEELVRQGRVEVDREIVKDLAARVDPRTQKIKVDGVPLKRPRLVYFALNKPPGVLSTNHDPSGRIRVIDFVPDKERVFSVGRLDRSSEGLILLTNDGNLAQRLAHPSFKIQKTYFVVVAGLMTAEELAKLRKGVHLAEGFARIDGATIRKHRKGCTELEIVLSEGKNREIRRILARAGHKVVLLRRLAIGTLRLGQLPVGAARELSPSEVKALYAATEAKKAAPKGKTAASKKSAGKRGVASAPISDSPSHKDAAEYEVHDDAYLMDDEVLGGDFSMDDDDIGFQDFSDSEFDPSKFESAFDDDFVIGFEASMKAGSVIGADDSPPPKSKPAKGRNRAGAPRPVAAKASASSDRRSSVGGVSKAKGRAGGTKVAKRGGPKRAATKRGETKRPEAKRGGPKRASATANKVTRTSGPRSSVKSTPKRGSKTQGRGKGKRG